MNACLSAYERETIITLNDAEDVARVWTAQRPVITKLKKNPAATLIQEGSHGRSAWASFQIPSSMVTFRSRTRKATSGSGRGFPGKKLVLESEK